eukprot:2481374-Rhodomonas_salina.2
MLLRGLELGAYRSPIHASPSSLSPSSAEPAMRIYQCHGISISIMVLVFPEFAIAISSIAQDDQKRTCALIPCALQLSLSYLNQLGRSSSAMSVPSADRNSNHPSAMSGPEIA